MTCNMILQNIAFNCISLPIYWRKIRKGSQTFVLLRPRDSRSTAVLLVLHDRPFFPSSRALPRLCWRDIFSYVGNSQKKVQNWLFENIEIKSHFYWNFLQGSLMLMSWTAFLDFSIRPFSIGVGVERFKNLMSMA